MPTSILFYSNYCTHCKKIIKLINSNPIKSSIKSICIDKSSIRSKVPSYVKCVPCIILGESNQILTGSQIIDWLQLQPNQIVPRSSKTTNNSVSSGAIPPPSNTIDNIKETEFDNGPNPFLFTEMSMFSDNYSFIDADTSAKGNGGESIVHNFEFLNCSHNKSNSTIPAGAPGKPNFPTSYTNPTLIQSNSTNQSPASQYGQIQQKDTSDYMTQMMEKRINSRQIDVQSAPKRI